MQISHFRKYVCFLVVNIRRMECNGVTLHHSLYLIRKYFYHIRYQLR